MLHTNAHTIYVYKSINRSITYLGPDGAGTSVMRESEHGIRAPIGLDAVSAERENKATVKQVSLIDETVNHDSV